MNWSQELRWERGWGVGISITVFPGMLEDGTNIAWRIGLECAGKIGLTKFAKK